MRYPGMDAFAPRTNASPDSRQGVRPSIRRRGPAAPMRRLRRASFPPAHAGAGGGPGRSGCGAGIRTRLPRAGPVRGIPAAEPEPGRPRPPRAGQVRCLPIAGPCPEAWCGACNGAAGARSRRWRGAGSGCCPISGGHRHAIGAGRRTRGRVQWAHSACSRSRGLVFGEAQDAGGLALVDVDAPASGDRVAAHHLVDHRRGLFPGARRSRPRPGRRPPQPGVAAGEAELPPSVRRCGASCPWTMRHTRPRCSWNRVSPRGSPAASCGTSMA